MEIPKDKKIILFDGVCNLCDGIVQFVIKHDKKDIFRFAPLQSDIGRDILQKIGVDTSEIDSIVLYEPGKSYFIKSSAALEIAFELGGIYSLFILFKILPVFLRNWIYDWVARSRYKWFGKKDACMIPTPEFASKFIA